MSGGSVYPVTVFQRGVEGYNTYRIPVVVRSKEGTLLLFAEGRRAGKGDHGAIDMVLRRSLDDGRTWESQVVVWKDDDNTCGNPAPVVVESGRIYLLMTWNLGTDTEKRILNGDSQDVRHVYVTCSDDDGVTWAAPTKISDTTRKDNWRWYATGPCNGIQLKHGPHPGRLVIPCNHSDDSYTEGGCGWGDTAAESYRSHVVYSDDAGATWKLGGIHENRTNESAVAELANGSVLQSMRSYHGKRTRAMAVSTNGGESFGRLYHANGIETPICQGSVLSFEAQGKRCLLHSNPTGRGRWGLKVFASFDEGQSWSRCWEAHSGYAAYSSLVDLGAGTFGMAYEIDKAEAIMFTTATLENFTENTGGGWMSSCVVM